MKNILLYVLLALATVSVTAKNYQIKGTFRGDVEGKTVYLTRITTEQVSRYQPEVLDSTVIRNGQFVFKGNVAEPTLFMLKYFPDDTRESMNERGAVMRPVLPLLIDGGTVKVDATPDSLTTDFYFYAYGTFDYKDTKITGSKLNDKYREYLEGYTRLNGKTSDESVAFNRAYYDKETVMPMTDIVEALDKINAAKADERAFLKDFIARNSDNAAGVAAFGETVGKFSKAEIEQLMETLSPKMKVSPMGKEVLAKADIIKSTATGAHFADVELVDPQGAKHRLSEYLGKGNYTLLEFWASWCGPCRGSIPHLKQVYGLYHPQGFDIVSVSMDDNLNNWKKALAEENMAWTQLACSDGFGNVAKTYNFNGIPYCVLIGPDGEVLETNCRDARLDRQLVKHYGNKLETLHIDMQISDPVDSVDVIYADYGSTTVGRQRYALENGKIDITVPIDKPKQYSIRRMGDYMSAGISFPVLPGEEVVIRGSIDDYTIGGSNFYQDYSAINEMAKPYNIKLDKMRKDVEALFEELNKDRTKNEAHIQEERERYSAAYYAERGKMVSAICDYIKAHPRQEASVSMLGYVPQEDFEETVKGLNYYVANGRMKPIIDAYRKQIENERIRQEAEQSVKEGVMAPDFTLPDINGKSFTLSSLRGKWVVLDFWGSWCGWCIKGIPDMKKYYEKYAGKFEIVGIDCRDTQEKWKAAVEKYELPWLHVYNADADGTPDKYAVQGYPTKIIIDPEGRINKIVIGESPDFYEYLDQLFGK